MRTLIISVEICALPRAPNSIKAFINALQTQVDHWMSQKHPLPTSPNIGPPVAEDWGWAAGWKLIAFYTVSFGLPFDLEGSASKVGT